VAAVVVLLRVVDEEAAEIVLGNDLAVMALLQMAGKHTVPFLIRQLGRLRQPERQGAPGLRAMTVSITLFLTSLAVTVLIPLSARKNWRRLMLMLA
jgi:hypothetical protein